MLYSCWLDQLLVGWSKTYIVGCQGALQLGGVRERGPTKGIRIISSRVTKRSQRYKKSTCLTLVKHSFISTNYISSWCRPSVGSFHLSISTICQKANYVETLESEPTQLIQIWVRKRHSLVPGFEPTTSVVPSQCTTNWAIQAWIFWAFIVGPVLPLLMQTQHTKLGPGKLRFPDINRSFPLSGHPELGEWLLFPERTINVTPCHFS